MHQATFLPSFPDELIDIAIFSHDMHHREAARKAIRVRAENSGIVLSPIHPLYDQIAEGKVSGFTVPAINLRTLTYDTSRLIFRLMAKHHVGPVIFEIAHSEMLYTDQSYDDVAVAVLAAALAEKYSGPLFLQADHVQVNAAAYARDADAEIRYLKALLTEAMAAGFYNIDIDASTVVDVSRTLIEDQQRENALITEELTNFLRIHSPHMHGITIGAEIGHIGDRNSTLEDFLVFMQLLTHNHLSSHINKIAIQTGSSHGGTVDANGNVTEPDIDFSLHEKIGDYARKHFHIAGTVQHGASTLPLKDFPKFVDAKTVEIHLSTNFQNIIFDEMDLSLLEEIYAWLDETYRKEKNPADSDQQFYYKQRKRALGHFKKLLWHMGDSEKERVMAKLEAYLEELFKSLNVYNTKEYLKIYE